MLGNRSTLILTLSTAVLLHAPIAPAQPPNLSRHTPVATPHVGRKELMRRDLIGIPGREVVMSTVEIPPGASSPSHRHYAQVFVYVLEGRVIMQVKGGPRVTLGPGQTFYESPTDIHTFSANASKTQPAKILAILIKDKGKPGTVLVVPHVTP